jgi:hypothetical protein
MVDSKKKRLSRLTSWQWAMVGLAAIVLVTAYEMWNWHRSSMAYRRIAERHPQYSEIVWLVPSWLRLPQLERVKWYVKRPRGFMMNVRSIDDQMLQDLRMLPTTRSLMLLNREPFSSLAHETSNSPMDASDLKLAVQRIAGLSQLESLLFEGPSISEDDLEELTKLRHLQGLMLCGSNLQNLRALPRLQTLKSLNLSCDSMTDAAWKHVSELRHLEELSVLGGAIRAESFEHLAACQSLKTLQVLRARLSTGCWRVISQMKTLENIQIGQVVFDGPRQNLVPQLRRLVGLDLRQTNICDESLAGLVDCPRLAKLILLRTPITDAAIPSLSQIPNLDFLDLRWTNVTKTGRDEFVRARPDVGLQWMPDSVGDSSLPTPAEESK